MILPKTKILSPREKEILTYVAAGWSNAEIGVAVDISHQTVKNHMTRILYKLEVTDRTGAAVKALIDGIIIKERVKELMQRYER